MSEHARTAAGRQPQQPQAQAQAGPGAARHPRSPAQQAPPTQPLALPVQQQSAAKERQLDDSVRHLQLVNALGTNNADQVLAAILRLTSSPPPAGAPPPSYGSPLHLVISLCSRPVVDAVVAAFCMPGSDAATRGNSLLWINARNSPDRETPLHIAARLGRADVVALLFRVPNVDDTLRAASGRTAEELAKSDRVAEVFAAHRQSFCDSVLTTVRSLLHNNESQSIIELFATNERARSYLALGTIDINAPIDDSERSILHYAAKADDLALVNWALSQGADPNVKDSKGKKPIELCKKDRTKDRLKGAISQAPIQSLNLAQATAAVSSAAAAGSPSAAAAATVAALRGPQDAPVLKGTLLKWTNYTTGYKPRYFVLENGSLSYYHTPDEYPSSCRGSLSTISANVTMPDSTDASRFDVVGAGNVRYSIKARSPADAKKWVWHLMESRRFMSDLKKAAAASGERHSIASGASGDHTPSAAFGGLSSSSSASNLGAMGSGAAAAGSAIGGAVPAGGDLWDADKDAGDLGTDDAAVAGPSAAMDDPLLSKVTSALDMLLPRVVDPSPAASPTARSPAGLGIAHQAAPASAIGGDGTADAQNSAPGLPEQTAPRRSILVHPDHLQALESSAFGSTSPGGSLPSSSLNIDTLLYLLEVQLEVQERVVHTVAEAIQAASAAGSNVDAGAHSPARSDAAASPAVGGAPSTRSSPLSPSRSGSPTRASLVDNLATLPGLLSDSVAHIQDTARRIVMLYDSRERMWSRKLRRETESRKRWEEVVSRVVGISNEDEHLLPTPSAATLETTPDNPSQTIQLQDPPRPNSPPHESHDASSSEVKQQPAQSPKQPRAVVPQRSFDRSLDHRSLDRRSLDRRSMERLSISGRRSVSLRQSLELRRSTGPLLGPGGAPARGDDSSDSDYDDADDGDVFYDAMEGGGGASSGGLASESFVEAAFGFPSLDDAATASSGALVAARASLEASALTSPSQDSSAFLNSAALIASLAGYEPITRIRMTLPLDPAKPKPTLAVWSFLKSAIGKDLTKITLPVFFNEPLSMLQRMCEDIEYIELLSLAGRTGSRLPGRHARTSLSALSLSSAASSQQQQQQQQQQPPPYSTDKLGAFASLPIFEGSSDPAADAASQLQMDLAEVEALEGESASMLRLMLVAAYAMSNYSSTVGRVNKPFNPMLGETYELVRPDKRYRYLSEQVCHHPPISACFCDSPDYTFWTEVNVKSKFWGKSLELHPLGNCHASLPLYGPDPAGSGRSVVVGSEHYSWKKVTTCVNNLIVGKLYLDHYGDMVVRNHRTGDVCTITFKPKETGGWFGVASSSSSGSQADGGGGELVGNVKDAQGRVRFELKGRWDDKLVAIPVMAFGSGVGGSTAAGMAPMLQRPLTLWKRLPLSQHASQFFNYTQFAMSLNQVNESLAQMLPPTDSRLRPDQTAMERGEWDTASRDKERLEMYQRERRKQIVAEFQATGIPSGPRRDDAHAGIEIGESWWTPRWFVREIEPDTREEHWRFTHEYWTHRQRAVKTHQWPEYVDDIFGLRDPAMIKAAASGGSNGSLASRGGRR
ncbi:hypothetical protein HK105_209244 [Polyrhizophydium stewartii]|uniref:PH domain-containing protein n=1 Tax=Polyrhizophydium stewartii TaxID=2732419 RepID=A0ABR4MVI9_9FUNG